MRAPRGRRIRASLNRTPHLHRPHVPVVTAELDEFQGDLEQRRRRRGVALLPSMLTLLGLGCGLSAVRYAIDGRLLLALALIGAAAILDAMDGRIARLLDAQSRMGAELDSLCDAIGFGVAPALITYYAITAHLPDGLSDLGWMAAVIYGACIVLRLARFNTLLDDEFQPPFSKEFFVGVPAPVAALLALAPVIALEQFGPGWWSNPVTTSIWLVVMAGLAFSRIPTLSLKSTSINQRLVPLLLIGVVVLIGGLVTMPLLVMLVIGAGYLLHLPFAFRTYRWLYATPEAWGVHGHDRRAMRRNTRRHRIRP